LKNGGLLVFSQKRSHVILAIMVFFLGALALFVGSTAAGLYPPDEVDGLSAKGVENLKKYLVKNPIPGNCTFENAVHRKEW